MVAGLHTERSKNNFLCSVYAQLCFTTNWMKTPNTFSRDEHAVYMRTSNPIPTIASRITNSCVHSRMPEISPANSRMAERNAKGYSNANPESHNFHYWYSHPK